MSKNLSANPLISKAKTLGDFILNPYRFENLQKAINEIKSQDYNNLNHIQKSERINRTLLNLILEAPERIFLLMAVIEFIDLVGRENVLIHYSMSSFEIWLNQSSGLSEQENYQVRGKIVGKGVPRDEYQILFPIGMGKMHAGSHFVTAHASPDLDTTIASFWGWMDAFGARVSEGLHIWNVPGGPPASSIEVALLFHQIFGQNVFNHLAKTRNALALSSLELMTQRGVVKRQTDQSSLTIDHERTQKAVILVDEWGFFLGDWRSIDVEGVRQVILLLNNCLRWIENHLHISLISLFAKETMNKEDIPKFAEGVFGIPLKECEPAREFTSKQLHYMEGYLIRVLKVEKGLGATVADFASSMKKLGIFDFQECIDLVIALSNSDLFDTSGKLIENRPKIFHHLEEIIAKLDKAIQSVRVYTERLDVALHIKTHVFGYFPQVVSFRDDVEELRVKMGNYPYLTVTSVDEMGKMLPLGVVRARDLQQPILGTVTLRDFCNREETKIPSYFDVISVIDHHKSTLQTSMAPVAYLSDAQSTNAVVAELAFQINDTYAIGGMSLEDIQSQIQECLKDLSSSSNKRILQRLLKKLHAIEKSNAHSYFIDPLREFVEYLHFLYAILDDTDLLTKVSRRDVYCVAHLLNRLKSLMEKKEMEVIQFDDLKLGDTFVERAATRILQHPDMYSLYRKIYLAKEHLLEENLELCAAGKPSSIFVDTKLQNGCVRIGQTKMFSNNFSSFEAKSSRIREIWVKECEIFFSERRECDLYLHMISTIAGAEDVFSGADGKFLHKDELWIWIPMTEQSIEHLKFFLNGFSSSPQVVEIQKQIEIECVGPNTNELSKIFKESFPPISHRISENATYSMAIIRFIAGAINSRKAMISPYLPKMLS